MTIMTLPDHSAVVAEIRLLFGPDIDDQTIEVTVCVALDDLSPLVSPDHLLDAARRLAMVRLDALALRRPATRAGSHRLS
jgi:hypothetical protein